MACLAEHEGAVQSLFLSKEYDPRGKYKIRLFDGAADKWETLVVDDFIPCDPRLHQQGSARPIFSQPNGNELWAILLEKAFAKFCGSYAGLEGGNTVWALRAMTGDHAKVFSRKWVADSTVSPARAEYSRADLQNVPDDADRRKSRYVIHGEKKSADDMFNTLRTYHRLGSVLCASGASGVQGLKRSHAYSILAVYASPKGQRLVKIRNPWGCGEWTGAWSDGHENWKRHPEVAKAVNHEARDDGVFWMSWEDFMLHWEEIGVVDRTVDISTLRYSVASGAAFPATRGCIRVCLRFWCRCWGCRRLYCPRRSSRETVSHKQGCRSYKQHFIAV
jgi:calpain-15